MKKVLVTTELHALLAAEQGFLNRADMKVFVAATTDDILNRHRAEQVDLIIMALETPGMKAEDLCGLIREDMLLRAVSIILVCANTTQAIERSSRCGANAVLLSPVHGLLLLVKAQQLLDVAARETFRVQLFANVTGTGNKESFFCRTKNISATGMLIETDKRLPEGTRISFSFFLPESHRLVHAAGKIVRTADSSAGAYTNQYGLRFTEIAPEVKQALMRYMETKSYRA